MRGTIALVAVVGMVSLAPADNAADIEALAKDLKSKNVKVRAAAAQSLASKGEGAARPLCDALFDPDRRVATIALTSLEKVRPDVYKFVSVLFLDQKTDNHVKAIEGIGSLGPKGAPAVGVLASKVRVELGKAATKGGPRVLYEVMDGAVAALGRIGLDDREANQLVRAVCVSTARWQSRLLAAKELVKWAGADDGRRREVLPVVGAGAVDSPEGAEFITLVGGLGPVAKDVLPGLKQLKLSKHAAVRDAAGKAVEQIEKP